MGSGFVGGAFVFTIGLVNVFALDLDTIKPQLALRSTPQAPEWGCTYRAAGGIVVAALASDLEGDIVGSVALDLEGAGREVVEVLVEELEAHS
jgi:hypothetical protein